MLFLNYYNAILIKDDIGLKINTMEIVTTKMKSRHRKKTDKKGDSLS